MAVPHDRRAADAAIREFAERHLLKITDFLREERVAIESITIAFNALNKGYAHLGDAAYADPTVGLLLNMLHRNFEHAEAALVACVTGSGASAEVISRTAVETSTNLPIQLEQAAQPLREAGGHGGRRRAGCLSLADRR